MDSRVRKQDPRSCDPESHVTLRINIHLERGPMTDYNPEEMGVREIES